MNRIMICAIISSWGCVRAERSKCADSAFAPSAKKYRLNCLAAPKNRFVDWEVNAGWSFVG
jgi:hypothetical protein